MRRSSLWLLSASLLSSPVLADPGDDPPAARQRDREVRIPAADRDDDSRPAARSAPERAPDFERAPVFERPQRFERPQPVERPEPVERPMAIERPSQFDRAVPEREARPQPAPVATRPSRDDALARPIERDRDREFDGRGSTGDGAAPAIVAPAPGERPAGVGRYDRQPTPALPRGSQARPAGPHPGAERPVEQERRDGDQRGDHRGPGDPRDGRWHGGSGGPGHGWTRDWRNSHHYDWRRHRDSHRWTFRIGRYYDPFGRGYRRWSIRSLLFPEYYGYNYWLQDPWMYRLPPVYGPYRWIRYYDDALLVDLRSGRVVDVVYNIFW